jgi:hypothetical protein
MAPSTLFQQGVKIIKYSDATGELGTLEQGRVIGKGSTTAAAMRPD